MRALDSVVAGTGHLVLADDAPKVEISHDWAEFLGPLRDLAGMFLALFTVVAVIALVVWLAIAMLEQLSSMRGGSAQRVIGIVACAALGGSLVSGVTWVSDRFASVEVPVDAPATVDPLPPTQSATPTG